MAKAKTKRTTVDKATLAATAKLRAAGKRLDPVVELVKKTAEDFSEPGCILDIEEAISSIDEGVTTLHLVADGLDQDDETKAACRFIADNMRTAAKRLQTWFDAAVAARQAGAS